MFMNIPAYLAQDAGGGQNNSGSWMIFIMLGLVILFFWWSSRSNKKREQEIREMRDNLVVGDEITTIGGIIGKIVSIKEETCMIETGKDKCRIRILKSAVRCVDVPNEAARELLAKQRAEEAEKEAAERAAKEEAQRAKRLEEMQKKGKKKAAPAPAPVEDTVRPEGVVEAPEASDIPAAEDSEPKAE